MRQISNATADHSFIDDALRILIFKTGLPWLEKERIEGEGTDFDQLKILISTGP